MHFFYLDETGCNGKDLSQKEQPIFVSGGIVVRDEGWNETYKEFCKIISDYFSSSVPDKFEFHTEELFSKEGSGFFLNHDRSKRNELIFKLLELINERKHQIYYVGIDKQKLSSITIESLKIKPYIKEIKVPYTIAYDYHISCIESYTKDKLGQSARALLIIDKKDQFIKEIEDITNYRRFDCANSKRIKWISEFSYPIDSQKNIMVQFSDMCIFLIRKYLEIENGYKDCYSTATKEIFRAFYSQIHDRLINKTLQTEEGRYSDEYNDFMKQICVFPSVRWKTKKYG